MVKKYPLVILFHFNHASLSCPSLPLDDEYDLLCTLQKRMVPSLEISPNIFTCIGVVLSCPELSSENNKNFQKLE
jgi:hypothetical protein